ncbi:MAG: hypothetical protein H6741_35595, partial [Alphaproteobacteria bacterium]|nr:hypothetical protein [Alphaproteobacteria bacterium]
MILMLLALSACTDKVGDDSGPQCGSTQAFISGTVFMEDGSTPATEAQVVATSDNGEQVEAEMAGDGTYELNVEGGQPWTLYASYSYGADDSGGTDCYSDDLLIEPAACQEYTEDIAFTECATVDKPNLYLYPEADQPTAVRLEMDPRQKVVASEPLYRGAWRGVAHPDGSFSVGSTRAPFLFYEVSLLPAQARSLQREAGWCLPAQGAVEAMAELLGDYGFNAAEREDFIEGWEHDLPPAKGYAVYPQTYVEHITELDIRPALPVDRLWLLVEDGAGCDALPEPAVTPFDRSG